MIDNLQAKLLPFYRDELLHSRPTDCHQLKAIGVAHIVTAPDLNLSLFAHETSSVEGTKGGKFMEVYCMDISFLQLPSHICFENKVLTRVKMTFDSEKNRNYVSIFNIFKRNPQKYNSSTNYSLEGCCNFQ